MARSLAVLCALLAFLAAGCGQSQKDRYAQNFKMVAQHFRTSVEKAGAQVQSGATLRERVPALRSFRTSVDTLASDLGKLDPPADLKAPNSQAVQELHTLSGDLSEYQAAAAAGDAARARRVVPKLQGDQAVLENTLAEIDRRVSG